MKNRFEDIIPPEKRSIRNIPLSVREDRENLTHPSMDGIRTVKKTTRTKKPVSIEEPADITLVDNGQETYGEPIEGGKSRWKAWSVIVIVLLALGYFLSTYFSWADINISLARRDVAVSDGQIPLSKINYTVVSTEASKTDTVKADGTEKISRKATGTVVIYNTNTASQKLSINTRLETSNGYIFKTDTAVTVPGATTSGGKKIPGSIAVKATAGEPGDDYNVGLKDFTLIGFKGTDKYTTIYARSKIGMSGGFVGTIPDVSQAELANTTANLKKELAAETLADITAKIKEVSSQTDDYIYIPNASIVEYGTPDIKLAKDGKSADVTMKATITALALSNGGLAKLLVQSDTSPQENPESSTQFTTGAYTADYSKFTLSLPSGMTSKALIAITNASTTSVVLSASGTAAISSSVDKEAITSAISRLSAEQAVEVIKEVVDFRAIDVSIKPWWIGSLPKASKIHINIEE